MRRFAGISGGINRIWGRLGRLAVAVAILATAAGAMADKIVIAHRGASGYLPEHTLAAYAYAHAQGAHYIEPDLVMTKDGVLICLHDIHLEGTTNVEEVFPDRKRDDGRWYAADLTIEEIKTLRAHERLSNRFPQGASTFFVPTFEEMIQLVQGLDASTGRSTGVYPELKAPDWHEKEGLPMEKALLDVLRNYGYHGADAKVFVQCFEPEPLKRMREMGSLLPQIMLMGGGPAYRRMLTPEGLDEVATYANGIGPAKGLIELNPEIVQWAHARGLAVHPYTQRDDDVPSKYASPEEELRAFYFTYNVDGMFTDFPDTALRVLESQKANE